MGYRMFCYDILNSGDATQGLMAGHGAGIMNSSRWIGPKVGLCHTGKDDSDWVSAAVQVHHDCYAKYVRVSACLYLEAAYSSSKKILRHTIL